MGSIFSCCMKSPDIEIINKSNLDVYRYKSTDEEIFDYINQLNEVV